MRDFLYELILFVYVELAIDAFRVALHGVQRKRQLIRNALSSVAMCEKPCYVCLAWCEVEFLAQAVLQGA